MKAKDWQRQKVLDFNLSELFTVNKDFRTFSHPNPLTFFVAGDPTPFVIYHDSWRAAFRRLSNPTITSHLAYSGWILGSLYSLLLPPL